MMILALAIGKCSSSDSRVPGKRAVLQVALRIAGVIVLENVSDVDALAEFP